MHGDYEGDPIVVHGTAKGEGIVISEIRFGSGLDALMLVIR